MSETYDAVIMVPIQIPAAMIEGWTVTGYDDLEDVVLDKAALGLQEFITEFRAAYRRG